MKYGRATAVVFAALAIGLFAGCGDKAEDATADLVESAAEAAGDLAETAAETAGEMVEEITDMTPEQIQAKVDEYKKALAEKETKLAEVAEKLKGLSAQDLMGDDAKNLKSESETLTEEIATLKEKLQPLMDKISG